jgi:hypothetical protein
MEAAKNKIGNKAENCIVGFSPEDFIYMHIWVKALYLLPPGIAIQSHIYDILVEIHALKGLKECGLHMEGYECYTCFLPLTPRCGVARVMKFVGSSPQMVLGGGERWCCSWLWFFLDGSSKAAIAYRANKPPRECPRNEIFSKLGYFATMPCIYKTANWTYNYKHHFTNYLQAYTYIHLHICVCNGLMKQIISMVEQSYTSTASRLPATSMPDNVWAYELAWLAARSDTFKINCTQY